MGEILYALVDHFLKLNLVGELVTYHVMRVQYFALHLSPLCILLDMWKLALYVQDKVASEMRDASV